MRITFRAGYGRHVSRHSSWIGKSRCLGHSLCIYVMRIRTRRWSNTVRRVYTSALVSLPKGSRVSCVRESERTRKNPRQSSSRETASRGSFDRPRVREQRQVAPVSREGAFRISAIFFYEASIVLRQRVRTTLPPSSSIEPRGLFASAATRVPRSFSAAF